VPPLLAWRYQQKNPPVTAEKNWRASLTRCRYGARLDHAWPARYPRPW